MTSLEDEPIEAQSGTIELYVEHPEPNVINVKINKTLTSIQQNASIYEKHKQPTCLTE